MKGETMEQERKTNFDVVKGYTLEQMATFLSQNEYYASESAPLSADIWETWLKEKAENR